MKDERERYQHPSYGMISLVRTNSGGKVSFFGSQLPVDHWITLEIKQGEMNRDLSRDWFFGKERIIEVRMTPIQFAELITNVNLGDGSPCTIEYANGKHIEPEKDFESKTDATHRQFKDRMVQFASTLKEKQKKAKDIVKKKILSKDEQHDLLMTLDWMTNEISSNVPYFMECFQEVADKVVAEARAEVEATITHMTQKLGLEELRKQNNLLNEK